MSEQDKISLTVSQEKILKQIKDFVFNSKDRVFILKGYAGTGKTTLMRFLIEELDKRGQMYKLLSTTGRAAKILKDCTGCEAGTIHSLIYKYTDFNQDVSDFDPQKGVPDITGQLVLVFEPNSLGNDEARSSCIYIVDESSMISDIESVEVIQARFGSGRTLKELLDYDTKKESKFIFVGDPCQLPPIEGYFSPALNAQYFTDTFGLKAQEGTLTEIMRQENSIVLAGAYIRKLWENAPEEESYYRSKVWGSPLHVSRYPDFHLHKGSDDMEQLYLDYIRKDGYAKSVLICNSNAKCYEHSMIIRDKLGFEGVVQKGELLMVVQNQQTTGMMNGDMLEVIEVKSDDGVVRRRVGENSGHPVELRFREITVRELFSKRQHTTLMLDNTLQSSQNNLDQIQQTGLFLDFILRMKQRGIDQRKNKSAFDDAMRRDPYLNALRCNYGYAITCHKAQGGEWDEVFILPQRNITLKPTKKKYQWFYTAITRAKQTVHLCKDFFIS